MNGATERCYHSAIPEKLSGLATPPMLLHDYGRGLNLPEPQSREVRPPGKLHPDHRLQEDDRLQLSSSKLDRRVPVPVLLQDDGGGVQTTEPDGLAKLGQLLPGQVAS